MVLWDRCDQDIVDRIAGEQRLRTARIEAWLALMESIRAEDTSAESCTRGVGTGTGG
jgi:hypothetical protein